MKWIIKKKKVFIYSLILFASAIALSVNADFLITDPCAGFDSSACQMSNECLWDTEKDKCCQKLEVGWPTSPTGDTLTSCTSVTGMIKYAYDWGISLGGMAAFISLVIAGFQYLTSVGDSRKMSEAISRIQSAFFGLILLFSSWLVLNTINPELTTLKTPTSIEKISLPGNFNPGSLNIPDCSFVEIYTGINFTGTIKEIYPDKSNPTRAFPSSYIIYQEIEDGETCDPDKEHCYPEIGGYTHKAGGACILELYGPSPWWNPLVNCGDKIATLGASAISDLNAYKESAGEIKCVKLIKINIGG